MNKKFNYIEQIEQYLEGTMSGAELETFERLLDNDPALQSEFQLQQDIVNAIKETRKAELKARLDNVNVSAYNGGISGTKIILTGALTAAIGLGIYFYTQDEAVVADKIDLTQEEIIASEEETIFVQPEIIPAPSIDANKTDEIVAHNVIKAKEATVSIQEDEKNEATTAITKINPPLPASFEEGVDNTNTELNTPKNKLSEAAAAEVTAVEIENKEDNSHNFHYKFYNNKLYLYGDFKNIPYELIELNTVSGKSLYLYYKESFYYLEPNQMEISPLNQIKDENLVSELDSLRKQKQY